MNYLIGFLKRSIRCKSEFQRVAPSGVLSAHYKQNTCDLLSRGKKKPVFGGFTNSRCFDKFVSSCHQQFSLQGEEKMAENGDEAGRTEGKDRFD